MSDSDSPEPSEACSRDRYPLLWALQRLEATSRQSKASQEAYALLRTTLCGLLNATFRRYGDARLWQTKHDFEADFLGHLFLDNRLTRYVLALEKCCHGDDPNRINALMFGYMRRCIGNWAADQHRKQRRDRRNIDEGYEGDLSNLTELADEGRSVADSLVDQANQAAKRCVLVGLLQGLSNKERTLFCVTYYPLLRQLQGDGDENCEQALSDLLEEAIKAYSIITKRTAAEYRDRLEALADTSENLFKDGGFDRSIVAQITAMKVGSVYSALSRLLKKLKQQGDQGLRR